MKPGIAILAALLLLILAGPCCFFTVHQTEYAVVTQFGKPVRICMEPGLKFSPLKLLQNVEKFSNRLLVYDTPDMECLTQDKKNVVVSSFAIWQIKDPLTFMQRVFNRRGAEARLSDIISSELGSTLGNTPFSGLVNIDVEAFMLPEVMAPVLERCRQRAEEDLGIRVVDFRIRRLNFPEQNKQSVFKRMRAERERIATKFRSEGEERSMIIRSEAERERTEILARAEKEAKEIRGEGEALAAQRYTAVIKQNPEFYRFIRTLEAYEKIINGQTTVVVPADSELMKLLTEGAGK
jgi:membrane protease subunit HflC